MTEISNTMTISDRALSQVSRGLINSREYKEGSIEIKGSPTTINNVSSNFSPTNYFYSSNFTLSDNYSTTEITFTGSLYELSKSCGWCLHSTSGDLKLIVDSDSIKITFIDETLINLPIKLSVNEKVKVAVEFVLTEDELINCSLIVLTGEVRYSKNAIISFLLPFSEFTLLTLGIDSDESENYWKGSIVTPDFALYQDKVIVYSPSTNLTFNFTNVLIGDGTYPLTDSSTETFGHVYKCLVHEIKRTENNVLLTAQITGSTYLNIRELALYCESDGNSFIFSKISNIALDKREDLGYDLIIHVNLDLNVVNVNALPEVLIKGETYSKFSSLTEIKQVYNYMVTNLERCIRLNALGVGKYLAKRKFKSIEKQL